MSKSLVIVESPAKAKTINKYLGKDFIVKSNDTINSLREKLEKKIHSYTVEVKNLRSKIENDLTEFNGDVAKKIEVIPKEMVEITNKSNILISEKLNEVKGLISKDIESSNELTAVNHNDVLKQFQSINTEIKVNRKQVKTLTMIVTSTIVIAVIVFSFLLLKYI